MSDIWILSLGSINIQIKSWLPVPGFWNNSRKHKHNTVEPMSESNSVINPDFLPCSFLYVVVLITITQQRQALSVKAWCSFPSIRLQHCKAFASISCLAFSFFFSLLLSLSGNACGLKLFKCSLQRTSSFITYVLDFLSRIFFLKDKLVEKCMFSSQRNSGILQSSGKTLPLIPTWLLRLIKIPWKVHMTVTNFKSSDSVGKKITSHLKRMK